MVVSKLCSGLRELADRLTIATNVVYGQTQLFTFFELLFEELIVSTNDTTGVSNQLLRKVSPLA